MASAKKQTKPQSKNTKMYLVGILCIAILALIIGGLKFFRHHKNSSTMPYQVPAQATPTTSRIDTGEGSYAVSTNIPHQMKLVSPKLGISFLYVSTLDTKPPYQTFTVKEVGDKVYLYNQVSGYTTGYFAQIFPKNPQDMLATAVQKNILQGYAPKDCFVVTDKDAALQLESNYPYAPNLSTAAISYPGWNGSDAEPQNAAQKCPAQYIATNSYFVMDKNHPASFAFVKLGQDNWPAVPHTVTSWDQTLQFLK